MRAVKIRRVGNSNVITIPSEFESDGFIPGASVVIDRAPGNSLHIIPETEVRRMIREAGRQIMQEDRETLDILAAHDRDE
jgi:antitoxin component of MazEF toxin-antitoxin module